MRRGHLHPQIAQALLQLSTPGEGAAALLLKHPVLPVFFPLAIAYGPGLSGYPEDTLKHYFLCSVEFETQDENTKITLSDDSAIEDLVLRGKLALSLFDRGPVDIRTHVCDDSGDLIICTLAPSHMDSDGAADGPSPYMRKAFADLVTTWQTSAEEKVQIGPGDPEDVATMVGAILSDAVAEPPYFPVLYVAVDSCSRKTQVIKGKWRANALAHNCYLLAGRAQLASDYIRKMFAGRKTEAFLDTAPAGAGALPAAIASVCTDLVHMIGEQRNGDAVVYARRNIPKSDLRSTIVREIQFNHDLKHVATRWGLLRNALQFLRRPHDDSTLVTAWVGTPNTEAPLPVGFVPGGRIDAIEGAAEHPAIKDLRVDVPSDRRGLNARLVMLESDSSSKATAPSWHAPTLALVKTVLDRGATAVRGGIDRLSGPYKLDFQYLTGPLTISRVRSASKRTRVFYSTGSEAEKRVYSFLHRLAKASKAGTALVEHAEVETGPGSESATDIVDDIQQTLSDPTCSCPLVWRDLFRNKKGRGWMLHEGTEIVHLSSSKSSRTSQAMVDIHLESHASPGSTEQAPLDVASLVQRANLSDLERQVIKNHYGLGDARTVPQETLAKELRVSVADVEDAYEKGMNKLRQAAEDE